MKDAFLGGLFEKSPPNPSKTFKKGFIKTDSEIRTLSVYEEPHGISDRLILSLAPAAILVPPPKMALTIVLGGRAHTQACHPERRAKPVVEVLRNEERMEQNQGAQRRRDLPHHCRRTRPRSVATLRPRVARVSASSR